MFLRLPTGLEYLALLQIYRIETVYFEADFLTNVTFPFLVALNAAT